MRKLIIFIISFTIFSKSAFALIQIDITRGNLDPLPIAISPLYVESGPKEIKVEGKIIGNIGEEISKGFCLS